MKRQGLFLTAVLVSSLLLCLAFSAREARASHPAGDVTLRDIDGNPIAVGNSVPYSPKQTCAASGCHDYGTITKGFHFQQGKDELAENPPADPSKPWVLSPGMYGKW